MVAAGAPKEIAFIVLLAGTGVTGEEILYAQSALIARASGAPEAAIQRSEAEQRKMYAVLKQEKDPAKAEQRLSEIGKASLSALTEEQRRAVGDPEAYIKQATRALLTPWFRYFLIFDPATVLRRVRCPVLALNGAKDLQVPPEQNLPRIAAALQAGGNRDVTIRRLPDLNHLFQKSKTGSPAEYGKIEETFSPTALKLIGDWIKKRS